MDNWEWSAATLRCWAKGAEQRKYVRVSSELLVLTFRCIHKAEFTCLRPAKTTGSPLIQPLSARKKLFLIHLPVRRDLRLSWGFSVPRNAYRLCGMWLRSGWPIYFLEASKPDKNINIFSFQQEPAFFVWKWSLEKEIIYILINYKHPAVSAAESWEVKVTFSCMRVLMWHIEICSRFVQESICLQLPSPSWLFLSNVPDVRLDCVWLHDNIFWNCSRTDKHSDGEDAQFSKIQDTD